MKEMKIHFQIVQVKALMFDKGQNVIYSKFSNLAYFKSIQGRLYSAPLKEDGKTIDFREALPVDYFFLEEDALQEAFMVLDILEETDENN